MSRQTTPKGSPLKHKGMKTSLYNEQPQPQQQIYRQPPTTIYTKPQQRIFVQTATEQPNVMPYIDSQYTSQPRVISQTHSEYVPVIERQNNFIRENSGVQDIGRVSPIQGSQVVNNLSKSKIQFAEQNRFLSAGSTFVPPPPASFLINNTRIPQHRSSSMGKTLITVTPPPPVPVIGGFQSVKKTFVPHHIINEIPVYNNSGSVYAESGDHTSSNNDDSQDVLLGYYEKLYVKYETEKQQSQAIRQQLSDAMNQINFLQSQKQAPPTVVQNQKSKVIDRHKLQDLLASKWDRIVDDVIDKRKMACISQVSRLVESCKVTIKLPAQVIQREVSSTLYYA